VVRGGLEIGVSEDVPTRWLPAVLGGVLVLIVCGALLASLDLGGSRGASNGPLDPSKLARPEQLRGRVNVWGWNIAAKSLKSLVPPFQQRHPNVDVNVEMSGANVQTRFLLSLSAGPGAPDVMQLQAHEAPRFIVTGRLTDLTAVAARYEKEFPAASWANCAQEGRVYAIPWDVGPCGVFYKPAIFKKYDIDPAAIQTWDDYIAAGQKILRASGGRTKMLPLSVSELQVMHEMLLQQLGGQVFDGQGRITINDAHSRQVMDLIRRMLDAGICANVPAWSHDWMAGFGSDAIATYPGAVWLGGTMKDSAGEYGASGSGWGVFPLPAFARGGSRASNLGGSVLVIPDQCADKEAAWAFIEDVLCTRAAQVAQYANFDLFPAYLPALEDPFFRQPDPFYSGQRCRELFAGSVKDVRVLNRTADWVEANAFANQMFSKWASEHGDTGQMLDVLARKLSRRLGRPLASGDAP
jgi:lactose/L-arabinose transport system substrate-binding protein